MTKCLNRHVIPHGGNPAALGDFFMKPIILEVREEVVHRSGVSGAGKPYDMHLQTAYLHTRDEYPVRADIMLNDGIVMSVGKYVVSAEAITQDRKTGRFAINPSNGLMTVSDAIAQLQVIQKQERPAPVQAAA